MNSINAVRPYTTLKIEPTQTQPLTTESAPAFKGKIGDKFLKEVEAGKIEPSVNTIFSKIKSTFGISTDKTKDVMESFLNEIQKLTSENKRLEKNMSIIAKSINEYGTRAEKRLVDMRKGFSDLLEQKNAELKAKDTKIAELTKYKAMAHVKSIEELNDVLPEEFLEIIKEAKNSEIKAQDSLLNFLFKGEGQEEFLAQMERDGKIRKAISNGILEVPGMNEAYNKSGMILGRGLPIDVAQRMVEDALIRSEEGSKILYKPIENVVVKNMDAILKPMERTDSFHNKTSEDVLNEVKEFFIDLQKNKAKFESAGRVFEGRGEIDGRPYYTFSNENGEKIDILLRDLRNGSLGLTRITTADGTIGGLNKNLIY